MTSTENSLENQSDSRDADLAFEVRCVAERYIKQVKLRKVVSQIAGDAMGREGADIDRLWAETFQLLWSIDEANTADNGPYFEVVSDLASAIGESGLSHDDAVTIVTRVIMDLLYEKSKETAAPQPATAARTPLSVVKGGQP